MAQTSYDAIIVGGGLAGLTTSIALAAHGLSVAVIDRVPLDVQHDEAFDGRASAIAYASCQLFEGIGLWPHVAAHAQPILEIRVSDGPSLLHLHFDHRDLGDQGPLGHMIENRHIRLGLAARLEEMEGITLYAPSTVIDIDRSTDGTSVQLEEGTTLRAPLILGVDGRMSQTRKSAGIASDGWSYGQVGIVCAIEHEHSHAGIAHERFLPAGPFAILPLAGKRSSLVWTEEARFADTIMALGPRAFEHEVQRRVGDFLGEVSVVGGRWCFPLSLHFAERYTDTRLALVGDAAHGIHPIAGQGLNMGLRDIAALTEILVDAHTAGRDIGSTDTLDRYANWRHFDNTALMGVTDGLTRLFSNDIGPLKLARDIGIAAVNQIPPLKRFFMEHARGTIGELPKLLRGEAL